MKRVLLLSMSLLVLGLAGNGWAAVWYVKTDGTDPVDCTGGNSWSTAFQTIQKAIGCASAGHEIWVKWGTYNLTDQMTVDKAVRIYGGFSGTESQRNQRNWKHNVTTVDGQDSVYHCLYITANATVDGFTITGGNANDTSFPHSNGGGIYNYYASPSITNCTLADNFAQYYGGGMYNNNSSATISNCIFSDNTVLSYMGGAMYNYFGSPTITSCIFSGNSATNQHGGAISGYASSPTITSCVFSGNTAGQHGGAIYNNYMHSTITNCTSSGNTAEWYGGAIFNYYSTGVVITNSILWGDTASTGSEIYNIVDVPEHNPTVTYCDVEGGYAGTGNMDADPLFVDDTSTEPAYWNLHLRPDSPCIDVGINSAPGLPATDFEGDPRIVDGNNNGTAIVDMGADEYLLAYAVLHQDGAIWFSNSGWLLDQPPYYSMTGYARDLEFTSTGYVVLHKDGALWSSGAGWMLGTPPYYPGSDYARALELRADGTYLILHRDGAIFDSRTGWVLSTPPYYPGTGYAVDLELR
jgi:predicted outer membrane repeat protein